MDSVDSRQRNKERGDENVEGAIEIADSDDEEETETARKKISATSTSTPSGKRQPRSASKKASPKSKTPTKVTAVKEEISKESRKKDSEMVANLKADIRKKDKDMKKLEGMVHTLKERERDLVKEVKALKKKCTDRYFSPFGCVLFSDDLLVSQMLHHHLCP